MTWEQTVEFDVVRGEPVPPWECYRLLSSVRLGRAVFTEDALPAVRPVGFTVEDETILISLDRQPWVAALAGQVVAVQADSIDTRGHPGWTVTATGVARLDQDTVAVDIGRLAGHRLILEATRDTGPEPSPVGTPIGESAAD
jgi:hypothetical protein